MFRHRKLSCYSFAISKQKVNFIFRYLINVYQQTIELCKYVTPRLILSCHVVRAIDSCSLNSPNIMPYILNKTTPENSMVRQYNLMIFFLLISHPFRNTCCCRENLDLDQFWKYTSVMTRLTSAVALYIKRIYLMKKFAEESSRIT